MKHVKKSFTLLEMIITIALVSIVLSAALYFYGYLIKVDQATEKMEKENFAIRYLQDRLSTVFTSLISPEEDMQHFFTPSLLPAGFKERSSALIFSYDNGIVLNEMFTGVVLGCLYVDQIGNLKLATWPNRKEWDETHLPPPHMELFLDHVDELNFEFYAFPFKNSPIPSGSWLTEWKKEYKQLPGIIRVNLKREEEKISFVFPVPPEEATIIYH